MVPGLHRNELPNRRLNLTRASENSGLASRFRLSWRLVGARFIELFATCNLASGARAGYAQYGCETLPMAHLVQFMHPGSEPTVDAPNSKRWNTEEHCRSFLLTRGRYSVGPDDRTGCESRLLFWGEWEAPSRAYQLPSGPANAVHVPCSPRYLAEPRLQNTDPFVFDGPFIYSCCKQMRRDGRTTYLRSLERGDIVLFGSHRSGSFVLDTVFVVRDSVLYSPHTAETELGFRVPRSFVEATLKPLTPQFTDAPVDVEEDAACGPADWREEDEHRWCARPTRAPGSKLRLYWGATPSDPVDGMFSFSPAAVYDNDRRMAFPRPALDALSYVKGGMTSGFRDCIGDETSKDRLRLSWRAIAELVVQQGLVLGRTFEIDEDIAP